MVAEKPPLSAWEYAQLKKDHTLDCILFLISSVSTMIITLLCADIPAGLLYYLQDNVKRKYLGGLSRVARYAYYFDNWHLLVMAAGAFGLLHHYPASYDEWLIQKANEEKSNPLFRNAVSGMVLIFSFILHLTKTPYGYTDSVVLYIYRAVYIGLVILTVLINRMAVYFINQKNVMNIMELMIDLCTAP